MTSNEHAESAPKIVTNSIGIELVLIPAGTFVMGSPKSDSLRGDNETEHQVTLSNPFYMGRTEVTQRQWKEVMGTEPWKGVIRERVDDDYPALHVSWSDAVEFCKQLSEIEGREYRLPTEAEWEYACRGGTRTAFSFGDDEAELSKYAWFDNDSRYGVINNVHRVSQKLPNPFGLHDMHGNASEWCSDWFGDYGPSPVIDPTGPDAGEYRVLRGGCFGDEPPWLRSAERHGSPPDKRYEFNGFRVSSTYKLRPY
ncbi:MAG: formylglycine-generating enzyme family protein [Planctomycetaceae bacterium]|nr:formylglycine-generating enzyme family protein [Planctomycetaceae bacterium]